MHGAMKLKAPWGPVTCAGASCTAHGAQCCDPQGAQSLASGRLDRPAIDFNRLAWDSLGQIKAVKIFYLGQWCSAFGSKGQMNAARPVCRLFWTPTTGIRPEHSDQAPSHPCAPEMSPGTPCHLHLASHATIGLWDLGLPPPGPVCQDQSLGPHASSIQPHVLRLGPWRLASPPSIPVC